MKIIPVRDEAGIRYGRLTLVQKHQVVGDSAIYWLCRCDCGNEVIIKQSYLRVGHTKSCGCLVKERMVKFNTSHGHSKNGLYSVRRGMIRRCYEETFKDYKWYGGRGIKVCQSWLDSLDAFIEWGESAGYEKGLELDRIDNDGDYCPENCRFVTHKVNIHNSRKRNKGTNEFTGVVIDYKSGTPKAVASVCTTVDGKVKRIYLGRFKKVEDAVEARNNYIREHNLPHRIQTLGERNT